MVYHWPREASMSASREGGTVTFYLAAGFELMALSSALEVLRLANRAAEAEVYRWRMVSQTGGAVEASCGISITPDCDLAQERQHLLHSERPLMAIVCNDEANDHRKGKALIAWLRECRQRKVVMGAFGRGVFALAKTGLLNDRKCSIHWEVQPAFNECFMHVETMTNVYVIDDNIWTCAGATAAFDMMVEFVKRHCGEAVAVGVGELAVAGQIRSGDERQRLPLLHQYGRINPTVVTLIEMMQKNLTNPPAMAELAAAVSLSRRQVERLFRHEIGRSPCGYFRELRLERARLLLTQSALPVVEVAVSCGFISASHFSKSFRAAHRIAPHEARKVVSGRILGRPTNRQQQTSK